MTYVRAGSRTRIQNYLIYECRCFVESRYGTTLYAVVRVAARSLEEAWIEAHLYLKREKFAPSVDYHTEEVGNDKAFLRGVTRRKAEVLTLRTFLHMIDYYRATQE